MKESEILIRSYGKVNLSIDVTGILPNGMHSVDMVMQQISLHDDVKIKLVTDKKKQVGKRIKISTNRYYLPVDERNLAYKACQLILDKYEKTINKNYKDVEIHVDIFKRLPVAAGLAGGSSNGAAVLHGLNVLFNLHLSLETLCKLGEELGSDVPFCIMGQARANYVLPRKVRKDRLATSCARASGTGTNLEPVKGIRKCVVLGKPGIGVSTKDVYRGIDSCEILSRPDNDKMCEALETEAFEQVESQMVNVLENYTVNKFDEVKNLKSLMEEKFGDKGKVMMTGSGPTVFVLLDDIMEAKEGCKELRSKKYEAYWCKTTK